MLPAPYFHSLALQSTCATLLVGKHVADSHPAPTVEQSDNPGAAQPSLGMMLPVTATDGVRHDRDGVVPGGASHHPSMESAAPLVGLL